MGLDTVSILRCCRQCPHNLEINIQDRQSVLKKSGNLILGLGTLF